MVVAKKILDEEEYTLVGMAGILHILMGVIYF
jgi:hypothetical protein